MDTSTYQRMAGNADSVHDIDKMPYLCVGIKPNENGILPPFASIGATPSVQVLNRSTSMSAVKIKDNLANRHLITDESGFMTRVDYTTTLVMMLRCSYSCVEAGVA